MAHGSAGYPDFQPTVFGLLRAAEWNRAKRILAEEVFKEVSSGRENKRRAADWDLIQTVP